HGTSPRTQPFERLPPVARGADPVAPGGEQLLEGGPEVRLVFHHENLGAHVASSSRHWLDSTARVCTRPNRGNPGSALCARRALSPGRSAACPGTFAASGAPKSPRLRQSASSRGDLSPGRAVPGRRRSSVVHERRALEVARKAHPAFHLDSPEFVRF